MAEYRSVQQAVIGEILPDLGRRIRPAGGDRIVTDTAAHRRTAGLIRNVVRVPQSVVKRVGQGGCHDLAQLRRQMTYIVRDEAMVAAWSNQIGIDREFGENQLRGMSKQWSQGWRGAPKRGHTDHIILSFPKDTDRVVAEAIGRDWGERLFARGDHGDRFRFVAALHANTEHVHVHFIVDKLGMDEGRFLSISRHSEINLEMMRQLHVEVAADYGLALNATSRLSRGIIEYAPREADIQAARLERRDAYVAPMSRGERKAREAALRGFAKDYGSLASLAALASEDEGTAGFMARVCRGARSAAETLIEGKPLVPGFENITSLSPETLDPTARLIAAQETLLAAAQDAWQAIREMDAGPDRVEMEARFAGQTRQTVRLLDDPFFRHHAEVLPPEADPYYVRQVATLSAVAAMPDSPVHAKADRALQAFRDRLYDSLEDYDARLERAGTIADEVAARFAMPSRSPAQIEAWRPELAAGSQSWDAIEFETRLRAQSAISGIALGPDLLEAMARHELRTAAAHERLQDLPSLDRLTASITTALSEEDRRRILGGDRKIIEDHVSDKALHGVVKEEIGAILNHAEEGHGPDRDRYSAQVRVHQAALRHHEARELERDGHQRSASDAGHELEL